MRIEINDGVVNINYDRKVADRNQVFDWINGQLEIRAPVNEYISDRGTFAARRSDFVWETHKGKFLYPRNMATPHLINAVNMIWNSLSDYKEDHPEIRTWHPYYIDRALRELTQELNSRV